MIMMSVMVISSLYFVEHLGQFRILPVTASFASFTAPSTWPCVRPSRLSLLLPAKSPTTCVILPLVLSMISPIVCLPWYMIRRETVFQPCHPDLPQAFRPLKTLP